MERGEGVMRVVNAFLRGAKREGRHSRYNHRYTNLTVTPDLV